jgi:hypothetical protein
MPAGGSGIVLSAGYTGIAGYTKYQVQLSVLSL